MRCETALGADTALLDSILTGLTSALCDPVSGLVDASNHLILALELRKLRRDDAKHDILVFREVCERLKASGTGSVVFEIVGVDVQVLYNLLSAYPLI